MTIIKPDPTELFDAIGYPLMESGAKSMGTFSNIIDHKPLTADALLEKIAALKRDIDDLPIQKHLPNPIPPHYWDKLREWNAIDANGNWNPKSQWKLPDA